MCMIKWVAMDLIQQNKPNKIFCLIVLSVYNLTYILTISFSSYFYKTESVK